MKSKLIFILLLLCAVLCSCKNNDNHGNDDNDNTKEEIELPPDDQRGDEENQDDTDDEENQGDTIEEENPIPVITLNSDTYIIGDTITFKIENYSSIHYFKISIDNKDAFNQVNSSKFVARQMGEFTFTFTNIVDTSVKKDVKIKVFNPNFSLTLTTNNVMVNRSIDVWISNFDNLVEQSMDDFTLSLSDPSFGDFTNNKLTCKKSGEVDIIATSKLCNKVTSKETIHIANDYSVFTIYPKEEIETIRIGEEVEFVINGNYEPSDFRWSTTDGEVLRVVWYEDSLKVCGIKEGTANISCYKLDEPDVKSYYNLVVKGEDETNYIKRFLDLAYSQVGVREEGNNVQKYGAWFGNNGSAWCATFVSWCWWHSGLSNDLLVKYQGCSVGMQWCIDNNIFKYKEDYTPKGGDIVFFLNNGSSHTGIVAHCDGKYIYTIEGNRSNKVDLWRLSVDNLTITGYATPEFPNKEDYSDYVWYDESIHSQLVWNPVTSGEPTI